MLEASLEVARVDDVGVIGIRNVPFPDGSFHKVDIAFRSDDPGEVVAKRVYDKLGYFCNLGNRVCGATVYIDGQDDAIASAFLTCPNEDCSLTEFYK